MRNVRGHTFHETSASEKRQNVLFVRKIEKGVTTDVIFEMCHKIPHSREGLMGLCKMQG